jgi:hypothetical protein
VFIASPVAVVLPAGAGVAAVDVGAAVAIGVAALCAWKPRTAAVPKTVADMTMGERFTIDGSQKANDS